MEEERLYLLVVDGRVMEIHGGRFGWLAALLGSHKYAGRMRLVRVRKPPAFLAS